MMKKYRDTPYDLKLNLIVGIQNNNLDEFQTRIKIQQAVKMTVKKFYFPCMKNVIFEVIYKLILDPMTALTFNSDVVANIVEIINMNGMSILKFKRILRILLTDFFMSNEFFFIHTEQIGLLSYKEFTKKFNSSIT